MPKASPWKQLSLARPAVGESRFSRGRHRASKDGHRKRRIPLSIHRATVAWTWDGGDFAARRYSRVHTLSFDGGLTVAGSPSPHIVPAPFSRADAVDPEAAFTASLSACHMLWFLDLAARAGFTVASYRDEAEGVLARNAEGRMAMTRVALRPAIDFAGERRPTDDEIAALHHGAHENCFIANSVKTKVAIQPPNGNGG